MKTLKIDREIKSIIPPLQTSEFELLTQSILTEGCRDAIVTWRDTIIDGHNRYEICKKHGIRFEITSTRFASRSDVTLWILENQLGRRNLSDAMRIEIAAKITAHTPQKNNRKAIAERAGLSEQTVRKYFKVKETADPAILAKLQRGEIKIGAAHRALIVQVKEVLYTAPDIDKVVTMFSKIEKLYSHALKSIDKINNKDTAAAFCKVIDSHRKYCKKIAGKTNSPL